MYYLETNSLITINNNLYKYRNRSFTSALSIFELISGLNEKNFALRRTALRNIYDCKLPIVWFLPESLTTSAFTYKNLKYDDYRIPGLKKLSVELLKNETLEEFKINTDNRKYNLEYFKNSDIDYSNRFINSTNNLNRELKNILLDDEKNNGKWLAEFGKEFIKSIPSNPHLNNSMTIIAIASNVVAGVEMATGYKFDEHEIIKSYNRSIDTFINAFSKYVALKSAESKSPARNDFIDLHHLLYLGNNTRYYIISNDKMISKITKQVISIKTFVEKY